MLMEFKIYTIQSKNGQSSRKDKIISSLDEDDLRELLNYDIEIISCENYKGKINLWNQRLKEQKEYIALNVWL